MTLRWYFENESRNFVWRRRVISISFGRKTPKLSYAFLFKTTFSSLGSDTLAVCVTFFQTAIRIDLCLSQLLITWFIHEWMGQTVKEISFALVMPKPKKEQKSLIIDQLLSDTCFAHIGRTRLSSPPLPSSSPLPQQRQQNNGDSIDDHTREKENRFSNVTFVFCYFCRCSVWVSRLALCAWREELPFSSFLATEPMALLIENSSYL